MQTRLLLAFLLLSASAFAWLDPAWLYRAPITVSNGGSAQTDYQVSVTLNTQTLISAGKMRSDCGDLRFASSADVALSYWAESGCNTASTKVWVKDASIPAGSSTIYAYYGNPSATSTANGDSTFLFFDDFPGTSLDTAAKWNVPGCSSYAVSGGSLQIRRQTCNTADANVYTKQQTFGAWTVARTKANIPWGVTSGSYNVDYFGYSVNGQWGNKMAIIVGNGNWLHPSNLNNFDTGWAMAGISGDSNQHIWEVRRTDTASYAYKDGALAAGPLSSQYSAAAGGVNFQNQISSGTDNFYADWVMVRKYAAAEPATSLQAEEQRPLAVLVGISPSGRTAYPNTNESFSLWAYNNQASADNFALSCTGTCYYSENPVVTTAGQNKTVTVTITSAGVSGTTAYAITATSQANPANYANASASLTVDAATWRSQWVDAYNNAYAYRTPITVTNNGSSLTDYQVPISISNLVYNNSGLVGSWHFSESGGTRFADSSGNGNDGTYSGETFNTGTLNNFNFNTNSGWVDGKYGKALQFDGADDYVEKTGFSNPASAWTLSAWIYPQATDGTRAIISLYSQVELLISSSRLRHYSTITNGDITGTTSISKNSWYHVVGLYDGTSVKLYINGILDGEQSASGTISSPTTFRIGAWTTSSELFNGIIDDVRVYSRALSASEIAQVYQNSTFIRSGLAAYWRFDEGSGTVAQDAHHVAMPDNRDGARFGNALSFDGINDYLWTANNPFSNSQVGSSGSVAAWLRFSSLPPLNSGSIVLDMEGYVQIAYGSLAGENTEKLKCRVYDGTDRVVNTILPQLDRWYFVVVTWNGTAMSCYVDGALSGSTIAGSISPDSFARPFGIGSASYAVTNLLNGTVDEVRVYGRPLQPQEIQALYGAGKLRLDYADLRFANSSVSQLPYWIENDNKAWVKVPYLPNGTSTVYAYYGSPGAQSAASGNATFDFFDDFGGDLGKWTVNGVSITSGYAAIATTGTGWGNYMYSNMSFDRSSRGYELTLSHRIKGTTWNQHETYMGFGSAASGPLVQPKEAWNQAGQTNGGNNYNLGWSDAGGTGVVASGSPSIANLWKRFTVRINQGSGGLLSTDVTPATYTLTGADNNMRVKVNAYTGGADVDDVRVRKYASPEPSGALLVEESANPAVMLGVSPAGKTTYPGAPEQFNLSVYNNQTGSDGFVLSCSGNCTYSENPVMTAAYQNRTITVTITSANISGTTAYAITAVSQANTTNTASISASITVDTTKWRDQWTDAYGNGYRYRVPIALNNAGSALTDYQVSFAIDTSAPIGLSRMRGDCGDLRVTNGTNELPYWVEGGCNTTSTRIWARVPHVPAGNSTVYAYYGNPLATYNNSLGGSNTFTFFDDFSGDLSKWNVVGSVSITSGELGITGGNGWQFVDANTKQKFPTPPYILEFDITRTANPTTIIAYVAGEFGPANSNWAGYYQQDDTLESLGVNDISYGSRVPNSFEHGKLVLSGSVASAYANDILIGSSAFSGSSANHDFSFNVYQTGRSISIDDVRVRKYASPEPSATAGIPQSKGYSTLVRRCGLVQPNATVTAYQANASAGSCVSNAYGICTLEIGAGIYDLQFLFADNSTAWKNGTVLG